MACYYSEYCFYSPSSKNIIDFLNSEDKTQINQETLIQVQKRYPDAIRIKSDDAFLQHEQNYKSDVQEITEAEYWEKLNILPPLGHNFSDGCETFKMSEMLTGTTTSIYCQLARRYYTFNDSVTLKHQEIQKRILNYEAHKSKH